MFYIVLFGQCGDGQCELLLLHNNYYYYYYYFALELEIWMQHND